MKFLVLGVKRKVVGNVKNYLYMKFQLKIFTRSRENEEKLTRLEKSSEPFLKKFQKTSFFSVFLYKIAYKKIWGPKSKIGLRPSFPFIMM